MTLSPFEIERQEFGRSAMGYKPREVDAFLNDMHRSVSTLWQERADLREENERLKERLARFEQIEEQLKNTLILAQDSAEKACEQARRESDLIMREAGQRSRDIVHTAHEERQRLEMVLHDLHSAEQEARQRLRSLTQTVLSHLDDTENLVADGASTLRAIVQAHPDPHEHRSHTGSMPRVDATQVITPAAATETPAESADAPSPAPASSDREATLRVTRRFEHRERARDEAASESNTGPATGGADQPSETHADAQLVEAGPLSASIAADTTGRAGIARTATADAFFDEPPSFDLSAFAPHERSDDSDE